METKKVNSGAGVGTVTAGAQVAKQDKTFMAQFTQAMVDTGSLPASASVTVSPGQRFEFNIPLDKINSALKKAYDKLQADYVKAHGEVEGPKLLRTAAINDADALAAALGHNQIAVIIKAVAGLAKTTGVEGKPLDSMTVINGFLNAAEWFAKTQLASKK